MRARSWFHTLGIALVAASLMANACPGAKDEVASENSSGDAEVSIVSRETEASAGSNSDAEVGPAWRSDLPWLIYFDDDLELPVHASGADTSLQPGEFWLRPAANELYTLLIEMAYGSSFFSYVEQIESAANEAPAGGGSIAMSDEAVAGAAQPEGLREWSGHLGKIEIGTFDALEGDDTWIGCEDPWVHATEWGVSTYVLLEIHCGASKAEFGSQ